MKKSPDTAPAPMGSVGSSEPLPVTPSIRQGEAGDSALEATTAPPEPIRATVLDPRNEIDGTSRIGDAFRIPSHGHGQLLRQPPAGVRGNPPPSPTARLRDMMREGLEALLPSFIADLQSGKINKAQGIDLLARYGIGATGTVTIVSPDVLNRLERQALLIASRPQWDSRDLLQELRDVWV